MPFPYLAILFLFTFISCSTDINREIADNYDDYKSITFWGTDTIDIVPDTLYVGKMNEGETSEIRFVISNRADKDIFISDIHSGCGCTTIQCKKGILERGKKTIATLQYNSSGQFGKQLKTISVFSKEGEERQILLAADVIY